MTPVMQHAVALARAGQWRLLDCLELLARPASHVAIVHAPGDQALVGIVDGLDDDEEWMVPVRMANWRWETLSGSPASSPRRLDFRHSASVIDVNMARKVKAEYTRLVKWLQDRADA